MASIARGLKFSSHNFKNWYKSRTFKHVFIIVTVWYYVISTSYRMLIQVPSRKAKKMLLFYFYESSL